MAILSIDSHVFNSSGRFDIIKLFNDQSATASSDTIDVREAKGVSILVESGAGVSGGVVTLEGAVSSSYAGTWVSLGTVTTNAASTTFKAGYEQETGPVPYVRARVSTTISGGTADVYLLVQK